MAKDRGRNEVTTDDKGVVVVVLRGVQSVETMDATYNEVREHIKALQMRGKKVLVLADITKLRPSDIGSDARREGKKMLTLPADGAAIVGNSGVLSVGMYVVRITQHRVKVHFFTSPYKAKSWLKHVERPERSRSAVSLVAGVAIGLIGLSALVGWQIHNTYLTSWLMALRPMNPLSAIGLLMVSSGFIGYWVGNMRWLRISGVFGIALGTAALLPLRVDYLVYGGRLALAGAHTQVADSAAVCFIAMGIVGLVAGRKERWIFWVEYVAASTMGLLSVFNIFGVLYARDFTYGISDSFVMAFNLAIAFAIATIGLVLLVAFRRGGNLLRDVSRIGWLIMAALLFVQIATYGAWGQIIARNKANASTEFLISARNVQTALNQRLTAYTDALFGFQGLFISSTKVSQGEFSSYYTATHVGANYPGLRALSFIAKVSDANLARFVADQRSDTSLSPQGNPTFTVTNKSNMPIHYVAAYTAGSLLTNGSDLSSNPSRLAAFQKAQQAGTAVGSGTVEFAATATQPAEKGFFITIPVAYEQAPTTYVGFVNAVFNYNDFFKHTFTNAELGAELDIHIVDSGDGKTVFSSNNAHTSTKELSYSYGAPIVVADRTWNLEISARSNFATIGDQNYLPRTILIGGQLFSLLLIFIFFMQGRARRQGFDLADTITEDLRQERNQAISNDQKSTAILSSIGDAVFAVDTDLRISLFNPSAEHISGFSAAEAIGKPYNEILKFEFEKTGRPNDRFIQGALKGRLSAMARQTILICKDGRRVQVADSAAPIRDAQDKIIGAIIVFRDISKEYELDKAKSEFVSLASHQLRTPLSAINWYGEMLLSGDAGKLSKMQHEYVTEIFDGNHRMIDLVNSLLDVSRLEVGKLASKPVSTDIKAIVTSLEKELGGMINEKHIAFSRQLSPIPPIVIDPKQLRMVIQNLMSNAVKYTPEKGSVSVVLRRATSRDLTHAHLSSTTPHWYFSIQDTGYGIPKDAQTKIFGKLYRADNVREMNVEGTGLGLYIVKEIIEKMGGRVWFDSVEGAGTTFYVVAPLRDEKAQ